MFSLKWRTSEIKQKTIRNINRESQIFRANLTNELQLSDNFLFHLTKDVFIYGRNTRIWLLQLREDLITLIILHQLNNSVWKYLSRHVKGKSVAKFYICKCPCAKLRKSRILPFSENTPHYISEVLLIEVFRPYLKKSLT